MDNKVRETDAEKESNTQLASLVKDYYSRFSPVMNQYEKSAGNFKAAMTPRAEGEASTSVAQAAAGLNDKIKTGEAMTGGGTGSSASIIKQARAGQTFAGAEGKAIGAAGRSVQNEQNAYIGDISKIGEGDVTGAIRTGTSAASDAAQQEVERAKLETQNIEGLGELLGQGAGAAIGKFGTGSVQRGVVGPESTINITPSN